MKVKRLFDKVLLLAALTVGACSSGNEEPTSTPATGGGNNSDPKGGWTGKVEQLQPVSLPKTNPMRVYAHYMPWFETPTSSGNNSWGWHWTMNTCNPDLTDNGQRQIASHFHPSIGPYASSDPTVLNYHALLMKYAGMDGAWIDWYGTQEKNDYAGILRNTEEVVKALERAGLEFAIVYEDATLDGLDDKPTQALKDMNYLGRNFFGKSGYVKAADGKPLLAVFGPQQLKSEEGWRTAFSNLQPQPALLALNGHGSHAGTMASGEFLWVNPAPDYSATASQWDIYVGGAMPAFHDYYWEGGVGDGYTTYDDEGGALFRRQLQAAQDAGLKWLQVSTWNDFGEGTIIEPTAEFGNRYLLTLQQFTGAPYDESALKTVRRWYDLKVKYATATGDTANLLSQAFYYLIALQPDNAAALLEQLD